MVTDLKGDGTILFQITSQAKIDDYSIILTDEDFDKGSLNLTSLN